MDTCATMSTGNLKIHQWLMRTQPQLVTEYIQFNDNRPFKLLRLSCAIENLEKIEMMYGKLNAIVGYWLRYHQNKKGDILSFGLFTSVAVNYIASIPTMKSWRNIFNLNSNQIIAK